MMMMMEEEGLTTSGTWWGFILFINSSLTLELAKSKLKRIKVTFNTEATNSLFLPSIPPTSPDLTAPLPTQAPGLRCSAGVPGRCDSGTADWCSSLRSSEPRPLPESAALTRGSGERRGREEEEEEEEEGGGERRGGGRGRGGGEGEGGGGGERGGRGGGGRDRERKGEEDRRGEENDEDTGEDADYREGVRPRRCGSE